MISLVKSLLLLPISLIKLVFNVLLNQFFHLKFVVFTLRKQCQLLADMSLANITMIVEDFKAYKNPGDGIPFFYCKLFV